MGSTLRTSETVTSVVLFPYIISNNTQGVDSSFSNSCFKRHSSCVVQCPSVICCGAEVPFQTGQS